MEYDIEELQANIEEVKKLLIHAKKLEELVKELDGPLTEEQMEHLEQEFSCMICVDITPLNDVVDRIDSALHHPEMYEIYTKVLCNGTPSAKVMMGCHCSKNFTIGYRILRRILHL